MAQLKNVAQKHTAGKLRNDTAQPITLIAKNIWDGSHDSDFPETIQDGKTGQFIHDAFTDDDEDKTAGSIAGLVYKGREDGIKWVVAWSNPQGPDSKVYTDIYKQSRHWDEIKKELDQNGKAKFTIRKHGYFASIEIDPKARSPTLKAEFKPNEA